MYSQIQNAWRRRGVIAALGAFCFLNATAVMAGPLRADSFESYPNGSSIAGTNDWMAGAATNLLVTNAPSRIDALTNWAGTAGCGYPLTNESHAKILEFTSSGSNVFGVSSEQRLWFDLLAAPQPWTNPAPPAISSNMLVAFYVGANSNLCVAHSPGTGPAATNRWTELPGIAIGGSGWARITVNLVAGIDSAFFSFRVDGGSPATNAMAFAAPDETAAPGGQWFPCANFRARLTPAVFSLSGSGCLDDCVVTNTAPVFGTNSPAAALISPLWDGTKGSITPGAVLELPSGSVTNFAIQASLYHHIFAVTTNGGPIAGFDFSSPLTNFCLFTWSAIPPGAHILEASYAPDLAASNTPVYWLADYYQTNDFDNAARSDTDGDGIPAWAEYLAGTDPTDAESVLRIIAVGLSSGSNYVVWTGSGATGLPPFIIQRKTNDWSGAWEPAGQVQHSPLRASNTWFDGFPPSRAYYRVVVTNAP